MYDNQNKPIIGILGGIGSGKSSVAKEFAKLGCALIDADQIAHEMLCRPEIASQVISCLGSGILDNEGKIDRQKIAGKVFTDVVKLASLNDILHPPVMREIERLISEFQEQKGVKAIVLDIPLLVEVGWAQRCDKLIFVNCDEKTRFERAKKSGRMDEKQIKIREIFQISLDSKANLADNTIENNSDFSSLVRQVADIFSNIFD